MTALTPDIKQTTPYPVVPTNYLPNGTHPVVIMETIARCNKDNQHTHSALAVAYLFHIGDLNEPLYNTLSEKSGIGFLKITDHKIEKIILSADIQNLLQRSNIREFMLKIGKNFMTFDHTFSFGMVSKHDYSILCKNTFAAYQKRAIKQ